MYTRRLFYGIAVIAGLLPTLAHASLTLIGESINKGQGFGNVINVLTLQQNGFEQGSVAWGSGANAGLNVLTGAPDTGNQCGTTAICDGNNTGVDPNIGKTQTQTFGTVGWQNAASIVVSLNLNQQGSAKAITLENLVMTVYSPTGVDLFHASLDQHNYLFTTLQQGTGVGYWIFELTAAEQVTAQAALFGTNYNANNRVGLSALMDLTSNDGPETFAVVNGNVVPEPGFYGALAIGLSGLYFAVQRSRRKKTL
jgi:hypothetical protein